MLNTGIFTRDMPCNAACWSSPQSVAFPSHAPHTVVLVLNMIPTENISVMMTRHTCCTGDRLAHAGE